MFIKGYKIPVEPLPFLHSENLYFKIYRMRDYNTTDIRFWLIKQKAIGFGKAHLIPTARSYDNKQCGYDFLIFTIPNNRLDRAVRAIFFQ